MSILFLPYEFEDDFSFGRRTVFADKENPLLSIFTRGVQTLVSEIIVSFTESIFYAL
jgi:hypothetical protein